MHKLVSIIVPVYNVEKYIEECIDSIIKQSYEYIEIVLVDDGSTDNSGMICDNYLKIDDRIKVFHKKNGGLSDARNYGINHSSGDYLVFIDSDDIIHFDMVKILVDTIENCDISIVDFSHYYDGNIPSYEILDDTIMFNKESAICEMLYQKSFLVSATGKMFKKKLFDNIEFPVGMLFEDIAIMYKLFDSCDRISYNKSKLYGYRHRNDSITTSSFSKRDLDILIICNEMNNYFKDSNKIIRNAVNCYIINANFRIFLNCYGIKEYDDIRKKCDSYIRKNALKNIINLKVRFKLKAAILLFIVSKKLLLKVYSKVDRWR